MTQRERVYATVEGRGTDYPPFHSDMTFVTMEKLSRHFGISIGEVEDRIDNHLFYVNYLPPREFREKIAHAKRRDSGTVSAEGEIDGSGHIVDEFGVVWDNEQCRNAGDWGMIVHPVKDLDFGGYVWPRGEAPGRFDRIESEVECHAGRFRTLIMTGLFDTAWHVTGFEDALMAMADPETSIIEYMLDHALEFLVGVIRQVPPGIFDSIRFIEDWGSQSGLVMGVHRWRRHLKPRLKELYAEVHERGLYVHSHSCGDNTELFGDLTELRVDISDPLQPEVMDIERAKERYGHALTFMGGLPCQSVIPTGSPEDVCEVTRRTFEILGRGGRYILGGAGSFPTETPVKNILAIVDFYDGLKAGKER